ncbi:long-chain-fatty-acid--CoA ligase [Parasphingorhabdus sp.]|uniref:long-chain-fatty-acid--CoA ligase n=1 Tax=Parasphingorhabdus sp. TaxID=2709688 RepID=UPI003A90607F
MIDLDAIGTLADIPRVQARVRGDVIAIKFGERETSYASLDMESNRVAHALIAAGISPGDRVSVLAKNHDRWFPVFFGSALARACLAPVNCRLAAAEIAFILDDARPEILFVGEDLFDCALEAVADLAAPPRLVALHGSHPDFEEFDDWLGDAATSPPNDPPQLGDDVLQLYTSGTTGHPKGVVLGNQNYRNFLEMASEISGFAYDEGETVMIVMPLFHVAGTNVAFSGLAQGGRLLLVREFSASDSIRMMTEENVAHAFLAPAMIQMMLQEPAASDSSYPALRSIAYGASPIAEDVLQRAQATFGCDFVQFYGMTESSGGGSTLSPAAHKLAGKLKSCGQPWPNTEMAILDGDGRPLGDDEIGEIAIRGGIVMKHYWNRAEATAETLVDGWLHTGDVGFRDADGFYFVHDRIKDMIVSGGENVYPAEVESAIMGCPGVADVAVIGVPDDKWGEAVKALIVPSAELRPDPADVIAWARKRIAAFKVPKSVEIIDELPRNPSGKVLRRELRAPYWEGRDRAVG